MPPPRPALPDFAARAQLFGHLAAMEKAGVPVERALLSLQVPARARAALASLQAHIAGGSDMASAGLRSGLFAPLDSTLLHAAQTSGCLAAVYQRLAERYNHRAQQAAAVKSRLLLPAAVLVLALFIQPLPALVGGQLSIAGYLWGVLWPLLVLGTLYGLGRGFYLRRERAPAGEASPFDGLLANVPILGPALLRRNLRDFFDSLGLMLEAGMPMLEALPKACAVIRHAPLRNRFSGVQLAVQRGQNLAQALASVDFPGQGLALGLIRTGEASGALPASLLNYAEVETQKLDSLTEQLATWLPRVLYAGVMLWMAYGLLTGGGFGPRLPADLG
ncbi:type II secretion system F family protein [Pseudomonas anguilliseptica]|uniref:General secretion pathway protein F n=1 Tax=Pseudomonas anguilliseptica TaxID=53406 RepID=A0A1H4RQN8_PSEAG|nr:type II secretion system F family protein [Pseudomonas anguilliseptica]SEC34200.1 general secretion pathway protein F [Pseudomonas anguilliseptica]